MNKHDLTLSIAKGARLTNHESETVIKSFFDAVQDSLKKGEKVQLVGFGSFTTIKRAARKGVNPKTKQKIQIPAKRVAKFVPGKELKDMLNKK